MATLFFTAIGYLQQNAQPVSIGLGAADTTSQNVARDFAGEIVRMAKTIDAHADALVPLVETSSEQQVRN